MSVTKKKLSQTAISAIVVALLSGLGGQAMAETPVTVTSDKPVATATVTQGELKQLRPKVNINQAGADELVEALIGVGPSKADAIVAWRNENGPFQSLADFAKVKGIGPATLEKNKDNILF